MGEVAVLKALLLLSAMLFFAIAPASVSGRPRQAAAPAQAAVPPAQVATPPAQTAVPPAKAAAPKAQAATPVKGPEPADAKNPVKPTKATLAAAKAVYNRDCALCHGVNGNGQTDIAKSMKMTMGNWTNPKTLAGMQDGELFDIIRVGEGKMPSEDAGRANNKQVWGLIHYIRGFSKAQTAAENSAR